MTSPPQSNNRISRSAGCCPGILLWNCVCIFKLILSNSVGCCSNKIRLCPMPLCSPKGIELPLVLGYW